MDKWMKWNKLKLQFCICNFVIDIVFCKFILVVMVLKLPIFKKYVDFVNSLLPPGINCNKSLI